MGREANLWNQVELIGVIVGVVQDMHERGPEAGETLAIYFSYAGIQVSPINFVVHANGDPLAIVPDEY